MKISKLAILLFLLFILFEMLECGGKDKDKDVSDSSEIEEETDITGQRGNGRRVRGQSRQIRTGSSHRSIIQNQHRNPNDRRMVMLSYKHQKQQIKKLRNDWGKLCKVQHKIHKNQKYIKKKMLKLNNKTKKCKQESENMLKSHKQNMKHLKAIFEQIKTTKASNQTDEKLTMPKRVKEETLTIRDTQDIQKIKPEHVEGKGKEIAPQDWKHKSMFEGLPAAQMPSSSQFASMHRPYGYDIRPYFHAESSGMQSNPGSPQTNVGDNIKKEETESQEDVDESE